MSDALQMRAPEKRANENCASSGIPDEWFQVRFFKKFLGSGSPSPSPGPALVFSLVPTSVRSQLSGASRPQFGLRPQLSVNNNNNNELL